MIFNLIAKIFFELKKMMEIFWKI